MYSLPSQGGQTRRPAAEDDPADAADAPEEEQQGGQGGDLPQAAGQDVEDVHDDDDDDVVVDSGVAEDLGRPDPIEGEETQAGSEDPVSLEVEASDGALAEPEPEPAQEPEALDDEQAPTETAGVSDPNIEVEKAQEAEDHGQEVEGNDDEETEAEPAPAPAERPTRQPSRGPTPVDRYSSGAASSKDVPRASEESGRIGVGQVQPAQQQQSLAGGEVKPKGRERIDALQRRERVRSISNRRVEQDEVMRVHDVGIHAVPYGRPNAGDRRAGVDGRAADQRRNADLMSKLAQQTAKLEASERAKGELEDMLLRIEKHFKTEQMLRRKAEIALDQMRHSLKSNELDNSKLKSERQVVERQKLKNIQERTKLDEERGQMQALIQNSGEQERKAKLELQEMQHASQTREEMIQYRLQASYSATIAKLEAEIERLREELEFRTMSMHSELQKWRQQAEFASNALREAKNEVIDRKRELDTTKERMDLLVEKLYTGRERGMELRGAIDVQLHQSQLQQEKYQNHQGPQGIQKPPNAYQYQQGGGGGDGYYYNQDPIRFPAVDHAAFRAPPPRNPAHPHPPPSHSHMKRIEERHATSAHTTPRRVQDNHFARQDPSPSYARGPAGGVGGRGGGGGGGERGRGGGRGPAMGSAGFQSSY